MLINQKQKQGVTIIELLIVIAAGVSLIAAGLILFSDLQNSQRVKDATANLSSLFSSINDLYKRDGTASLTEAELVAAGAIPDGMVIVGGDVKNVWGGEVDFAITGAGSLAFDVIYQDVPANETCVDFVENQRGLGWDSADVAGSALDFGDAAPATTSDIITACSDATLGADVATITFFQD